MQTTLNITVLEQLIDSLQACFSVDEASVAIAPLMQQLFPNAVGAVYVMSFSKSLLEAIASWGSIPLTSDPIFTPHECLALERQHPHLVEDTHHGLVCQHIQPNVLPVETFCVPMMAHGETLGMLYVGSLERGQITETKTLAVTVAKQIGLALANLKLRETLNNQSLRDPVTQLYNRRYLEETLEREIRRSDRHPQSIGIILLDIDRFNEFNDTGDRKVGNYLLREMGQFLPKQIRASDIACRYASETFLLLLPDVSLEIAYQRAEQVRQSIKDLNLHYRSQSLDSITISCGVASFPEHGLTGRELIQAANEALNDAKSQGGDHVAIASRSNP